MRESIYSSAGKLGNSESIEWLCLSLEKEKYSSLSDYRDSLIPL
jgi:hypothetical protein